MQHQFTLSDVELQRLLNTAAELGARRALIGAGMDNPMLTYNQAVKRFGRSNMELWRKQGRIKPVQHGMNATHWYPVQDLLRVALTEERHNYLSVAERRVV